MEELLPALFLEKEIDTEIFNNKQSSHIKTSQGQGQGQVRDEVKIQTRETQYKSHVFFFNPLTQRDNENIILCEREVDLINKAI